MLEIAIIIGRVLIVAFTTGLGVGLCGGASARELPLLFCCIVAGGFTLYMNEVVGPALTKPAPGTPLTDNALAQLEADATKEALLPRWKYWLLSIRHALCVFAPSFWFGYLAATVDPPWIIVATFSPLPMALLEMTIRELSQQNPA